MTERPSGGAPGTVLERDRPARSRPAPDPRLRARRIEVRRTEGRKRLRRLLLAVAVTLVSAAAWGVTRSPLLDLDHVDVTGTSALDADQVRDASGLVLGDPLLDLDLGAAAEAVRSLAWVESAEAHRRWSGTVDIVVAERTPVALLVVPDASAWLVDGDGWVIAPATTADRPDMPRVEVSGVPGAGQVLDGPELVGVEVARSLTVGLAAEVDAIEVSADGSGPAGVWLRLRPDAGGVDPATLPDVPAGRVHLGDARDLADQLVAAETMVTRVDLTCVDVVDVRVASSPVVTRHPECGA